jgi:hypothetical protein
MSGYVTAGRRERQKTTKNFTGLTGKSATPLKTWIKRGKT